MVEISLYVRSGPVPLNLLRSLDELRSIKLNTILYTSTGRYQNQFIESARATIFHTALLDS